MYAITGITGKVGGAMARALLAAGQPVRAIVRDATKGRQWAALGCDVAIATMEDAEALTQAFKGATAVFILPPPVFDPEPFYPEAQAVIDSVATALRAAKPARVVCLSTVGADAVQDNLLSQHTKMETALSALPLALTLLRPAWFLDNVAWDVSSARGAGLIHSFLAPTGRALPMVAAEDVGRVAATLIQQDWSGTRIVELEGPERVSPDDLAAAFTTVLGKPVRAVPVPRETWEALFRSQGMRNPQPRMRMLDGFNEGWIAFADEARTIKATISATTVVQALVAGEGA
ncbi:MULTISPECIES: NAD(P)H-binding protein [Mesorhizobium]|nr:MULTISPECIES: NAD(P)H-binding protein [Mesorhizobium]ETA72294.1 putative nucleoside-diphosphate sugar epimerase [Mesorhizobium japonicum R7A]OBP75474.1 NmrA family transcriptional regulator [Mesorhizobium loti]OBP76888.1 NmrA family transcriptional regulator [Mesorhizobium loti]OBP84912.1 NmrA family transcriptional regulator [Mesorhizobium loti]OBP86416.1 NmrA family transcriptional regulator [Mesorhizobium loti]